MPHQEQGGKIKKGNTMICFTLSERQCFQHVSDVEGQEGVAKEIIQKAANSCLFYYNQQTQWQRPRVIQEVKED